MDFVDFSAAVFLGNVLTLCAYYSFKKFAEDDYKAPWLAYFGVLFPVFLVVSSVWLNR